MAYWEEILANQLSLGKIWQKLDRELRLQAAQAFYTHDWEDGGVQTGVADAKVAAVLRFRPIAVRKLPVEQRARTLANSVRPDAELASAMLMAFHIEHRQAMMAGFLDAMEIPHENGLIDGEHELEIENKKKLASAVDEILKTYPRPEVDLYLATLYLTDPKTWHLVPEVMKGKLKAA